MKVITEGELTNSAAVMDAVEAGEIYHITRNGLEVAELRPLTRRRRPSATELVERHRGLPQVDHLRMRQEADRLFRTEDGSTGSHDRRHRLDAGAAALHSQHRRLYRLGEHGRGRRGVISARWWRSAAVAPAAERRAGHRAG